MIQIPPIPPFSKGGIELDPFFKGGIESISTFYKEYPSNKSSFSKGGFTPLDKFLHLTGFRGILNSSNYCHLLDNVVFPSLQPIEIHSTPNFPPLLILSVPSNEKAEVKIKLRRLKRLRLPKHKNSIMLG